jgi:hypothetical protein
MKKILGEYLKYKKTADTELFYWYRLDVWIIILFFLTAMLVAYGIAETMGYEAMGELQVIEFSSPFRIIYWMVVLLLTVVLLFNQKSKLAITGTDVKFKKRPLTGKTLIFNLNQVSHIGITEPFDIAESDVGISREIYNFSVLLKSGKKIRIGSFNRQDCERLKSALGH